MEINTKASIKTLLAGVITALALNMPTSAQDKKPAILTTELVHTIKEVKVDKEFRVRSQIYRHRFLNQPNINELDIRGRIAFTYNPSPLFNFTARGCAEAATKPNLDSRLQESKSTFGSELFVDRLSITGTPHHSLQVAVGELENPYTASIPAIDKDIPIVGGIISLQPNSGIILQGIYDGGRLLTQDTKTAGVGVQILARHKLDQIMLQGNIGQEHSLHVDNLTRLSNSANTSFNIFNAGGSITLRYTHVPPITLLAEYVQNTAQHNQNQGIMTGIKFGNAQNKGDFSIATNYWIIERDALIAGMVKRESPRSNFNSYGIKVEYRPANPVGIYGAANFPKHIVPLNAKDRKRQSFVELGTEVKF